MYTAPKFLEAAQEYLRLADESGAIAQAIEEAEQVLEGEERVVDAQLQAAVALANVRAAANENWVIPLESMVQAAALRSPDPTWAEIAESMRLAPDMGEYLAAQSFAEKLGVPTTTVSTLGLAAQASALAQSKLVEELARPMVASSKMLEQIKQFEALRLQAQNVRLDALADLGAQSANMAVMDAAAKLSAPLEQLAQAARRHFAQSDAIIKATNWTRDIQSWGEQLIPVPNEVVRAIMGEPEKKTGYPRRRSRMTPRAKDRDERGNATQPDPHKEEPGEEPVGK